MINLLRKRTAILLFLVVSTIALGSGAYMFNSGSGGSAAAVWGQITGTIGDQTDLGTQLSGKLADPGTVTDDGLVTWDGTGGATVQSQAEITVADTGKITITPSGSPSGVLSFDISGSTPTTGVISYAGATIPTSLSHIDNMSGLTLPGGTNAMILRRTSANGGSYSAANAYIMGNYTTVDTTHVGKNLGVYDSANQGVYGVHSTVSAGSNGGARGILAVANNSNYAIGATFAGILPTGSSPQTYGVRAYATGENSAQQVGGYFRIYTTQTEANEIKNPATSAGLIADNGDTTHAIANFMDNAVSMVSITDGGNTLFGKTFAIATSVIDLTGDDQSVTVTTAGHIRFTSDNSTATNRTIVLGNGSHDGQRLTLEWAESAASGAGELPDDTNNNVRLSAAWTPDQYDTLSLVWNSGDSNWLEVSRSDN